MLFSPGTTSEQVVRRTLGTLFLRHKRKSAFRGIQPAHIQRMAQQYERWLTQYQNQGKALALLTRMIETQLLNEGTVLSSASRDDTILLGNWL